MKSKENLKKVKIYETVPEDWGILKDALTAPVGYKWIWNRKTRFGGNRAYQDGLLREAKGK